MVDELLHRKKECPLPQHASLQELTERFSVFFSEKIAKIRTDLDKESTDDPEPVLSSKLRCFKPVSQADIQQLICKAPAKTRALDPLPSSLLKEHCSHLQ